MKPGPEALPFKFNEEVEVPMDVKIVDVALKARVSPTTVSRVLNNYPLVKAKTREKVLQVIEELNYVPHAAAKNLRRQRTMTIGVVVPDVRVSYYTDVVKGIQAKAYSEKFKVVICDTNNDRDIELEYLKLLSDRSVDGMILVTSMLSDQEVLEMVDRGYAIGVVGRSILSPKIVNVHTDNVKSAKEAVTHLIEQGHRKIAFLSGYANAMDSYDRLEGYIKAIKEHEIPFVPEYVENGNFNEIGGYEAMKRLWDKGLSFTAVFSANDEMALGVYRACQERGISIPEDLAVVGVDNDRVSQYLSPTLTTVNQPKFEMGYKLAEKLLRQLNDETAEQERVTILESELVIRQSSLTRRK